MEFLERVLLESISVTRTDCETDGAVGEAVYGIEAIWDDGSKIAIRDFSASYETAMSFCRKIAGTDMEKVHFYDVVEDYFN